MLVSVIIPAYNAQQFIAEALDSVFSQTYKNFEVIVINDGSTDGTQKLLERYKNKFGEQLIIINQSNQGQVIAKNNGLKVAKGEFIAFLDSDDKWAPEKLQLQLDLMSKSSNIGLCYTEAILINEKGAKIGYRQVNDLYKGKCFERLIMRNNITASSVMIRKECIDKVGFYDEKLKTCENWDLWLRISRFYELSFIKKPLAYYRIHKGHMSNQINRMRKGRIYVIKKHAKYLPSHVYKEALFNAHLDYAKNYIWNLYLKEARQDLIEAIKLKPTCFECYKFYVKSLLGRSLLKRIRTVKENLKN